MQRRIAVIEEIEREEPSEPGQSAPDYTSGGAITCERTRGHELGPRVCVVLDHVFDGLVARPAVTPGAARLRDRFAGGGSGLDGGADFLVTDGVADANEHLL